LGRRVKLNAITGNPENCLHTGIIDDAREKGAKNIKQKRGTIRELIWACGTISPVNKEMRCLSEEQFGPVITYCNL